MTEEATFGKGTRVRITTGEATGVEGEIFWWGRSKWGYGMRAGVKADASDDKFWVDASELVAIDENGDALDPQPTMTAPSFRTEIEIRGVDVPYALGRTITALRIAQGLPPGRAATATVRLDRLRATEIALGCRIPDPIVAYVVSGVGSLRDVTGLITLTGALREQLGTAEGDWIAFDKDRDDYLAFRHSAAAEDAVFFRLSAANAFTADVEEELETRLAARLTGAIDRATPALEVIVDYVTTTEPNAPVAPAEEWVTHKTFGRGLVTGREGTSKGDKLTIRFADGETRKLLATFVQPAE